MIINVKTIVNRNLSLDTLEKSHTVLQLKETIAAIEGIPAHQVPFRLYLSGRLLQDDDTIEASGITDGSTVHCILPIR